MNIFIAGIHGVGKTFLASRAAHDAGMTHTSASKLIKEERALPSWSNDKRVVDVDENQIALAAAVRRHNVLGTRLLLDGHFVLLNSNNEMIRLEGEVFASLSLNGVILIEAEPLTIARRIEERDQRRAPIDHLQAFMKAERDHAQMVCAALHIPFALLDSPSSEEFAASIASFI